MIKSLLNWFGKGAEDAIKSCPAIQGHVTIQMLDQRGKLKYMSEGYNIWTLTGREYLSELVALQQFTTPRTTFRDDRIAYIGMGLGAQPEVAEVESLVESISYDGTNFLAPLVFPATFPSSSSSTTKTAVQFIRTFQANELNNAKPITEAGLFTDGDPDQDFALGAPTSLAAAKHRAPVAYKTFEPISKTSDFTMKIIWEVRFV